MNGRSSLRPASIAASLAAAVVILGGWGNGPSGNATTNLASECSDPPYATHDWIADHALDMLLDAEKAWLVPHRTMYLLGTEAPDNDDIPTACGAPNTGYDDRFQGHSVDWNDDHTEMFSDRAARRAQEEYNKAVIALLQDEPSDAAFYLGAMAHYVGDVSQYGHAVPFETSRNHRNYESWAKSRTDEFAAGVFEDDLVISSFVRRTPYTAVKRTSNATSEGAGAIKPAQWMEDNQGNRNDPEFMASVGASLNKGVNELADILHTFFLNVVSEG